MINQRGFIGALDVAGLIFHACSRVGVAAVCSRERSNGGIIAGGRSHTRSIEAVAFVNASLVKGECRAVCLQSRESIGRQ